MRKAYEGCNDHGVEQGIWAENRHGGAAVEREEFRCVRVTQTSREGQRARTVGLARKCLAAETVNAYWRVFRKGRVEACNIREVRARGKRYGRVWRLKRRHSEVR